MTVARASTRYRTALFVVVVTAVHIALVIALAHQWRQVVPRWRSWDDASSIDAMLVPDAVVAPPELVGSEGEGASRGRLRPTQPEPPSPAMQASTVAAEHPVKSPQTPVSPLKPTGQSSALDRSAIGSILRGRTGCRRDATTAAERERCEQQLGALGKEAAPVEGADIPAHVRQEFDQSWKDNHTSQFVRLGCFARFGQGKVVTYKTTRGVNFGPCFFATSKGNLVPNKPKPKGF